MWMSFVYVAGTHIKMIIFIQPVCACVFMFVGMHVPVLVYMGACIHLCLCAHVHMHVKMVAFI